MPSVVEGTLLAFPVVWESSLQWDRSLLSPKLRAARRQGVNETPSASH